MKVILLQDVKKVGKKDQIIEVSIGYANNFLFSRHLAVPYTEKSVEILEKQQNDAKELQAKLRLEAEKIAKELENITLEFKAKVGKDGKMFGSISTKQIVEKLESQYNYKIDKRKFVSNDPVSNLGYANLKVELFKGVFGTIKVHVSEETK